MFLDIKALTKKVRNAFLDALNKGIRYSACVYQLKALK